MQKIGFCERYMLTTAVLKRFKTNTRRLEKALERAVADYEKQYGEPFEIITQYWDEKRKKVCCLTKHGIIHVETHYELNEVVAVAQSYRSIHEEMTNGDYGDSKYDAFRCAMVAGTKGWDNKLFVRPDLMPHQIQITDINIERLQDITDEDCLKEGIRLYTTGIPQCKTQVVGSLEFIPPYGFDDYHQKHFCNFDTPRKAFAALINRPGVGRKGLWESNTWVVVYEFKLIK